MIRLSHIGLSLALGCSLAVLASAPAHAQLSPSGQVLRTKPKTSAAPAPAQVAPPPALPGALNGSEPAEKTDLDLPPTESLFDAINRGDIAAARDAIARGADLNGRNVLGISPVELSIDLSRNDITFLLLSLRGPDGAAAAKQVKAADKVKVAAVKPPAPAAKPVAAAKPAPAAAPAQQRVATTTDPGTPNPQAGFLGFGGAVQ